MIVRDILRITEDRFMNAEVSKSTLPLEFKSDKLNAAGGGEKPANCKMPLIVSIEKFPPYFFYINVNKKTDILCLFSPKLFFLLNQNSLQQSKK